MFKNEINCLPIITLRFKSGGVPTVHRAGPLLPALATQVTPVLPTTSSTSSPRRPEWDQFENSP